MIERDLESGSYQLNAETTTEEEKLHDSAIDFPDGGWRAWSIVFGSCCGMMATFGVVNSTGFIQSWLSLNQLKDKSDSQVSWVFSIYLFLFFFGGVQVGPIFDAYGIKAIYWPGCVGSLASVFILSVCKEYYQFILGFSILGGISNSMVFTPSVTVIGHWFYKRRGLATGVACTGGALGGIVFPLVLKALMPHGFGNSIRAMGYIMIGLCVISASILQTRIPRNKKAGAAIDVVALKDPSFALVSLGVFMIEWGLFVPLNYITSYALSQGVDDNLSYTVLVYLNVASVLGRSLPGYFADIFGRFNVMVITSFFSGLFCLALWLPTNNSNVALVFFAVLFGFWSGSSISLTPVCISQICETKDYGKRYGTCYFICSFGALTGLPIAGAILDRQKGNYTGLIVFAGCCYLAGSALFLATRIIGVGWDPRKVY